METNEVSRHQVQVFRFMQTAGWVTSAEVATAAKVAPRTARLHLLKLSQLGLVDVAALFPGHRYRMSDKASKRNAGYLRRLEAAAEVFGL